MAAASPSIGRRRFSSQRARDEALTAYLFLMPYLLVTAIFLIGVIAFAVIISFTQFDLFTWPPKFVGLDNYKRALTDLGASGFIRSLVNIFWYVIIVTPLQTVAALGLAVLLNAPMRAKQFFRTIFYAPSVAAPVVISLIFFWLYLKTGYLNYGLDRLFALFGGKWTAVDWLGDARGLFQLIAQAFGGNIPSNLWYLRGPSIAWMAIMFQNIFTTAPTFMIMFLAALQDIPPSLYEAAALDGANKRQQFWNITVPMLRPVILLVIVLGTIGTFQIFDQIKVMTEGGPLGTTLVPVYLIYTEALGVNGPPRMGLACAMALLLAALIFMFTFIQRRYIESGTEQY
jgi:multiple sugar transport system permease protein